MSALESIRRLYVDYAIGLDTRDFARTCDVVATWAYVVGTSIEGEVDEYLPQIISRVTSYALTMHDIGTTDIVIHDERRASVNSYSTAHHLGPLDGGDPWIIAIRYSDELELDAARGEFTAG